MGIFDVVKNCAKNVINGVKNVFSGGGSSDDPHVVTNFSNKQETVMNLINETVTQIETNIESNTTASNNVGKVNVVATKGSKIKINLEQTANVQAAQVYMSMIDMLMKSDANTDVKLDALAAVCQAVKNDGNVMQSPEASKANIQLVNSKESNITNIQKLNQSLKLAVSTCAVNNFEGGNFLADEDSEIDFKLNQKADAISDSLTKMITSEKSTLTDDEKSELKSEIEADNKAEGTGIIAGLGHEAGSTVRNVSDNVADTAQKISGDVSSSFKWGTGMIIGVIAVPIIIIILIIGIIVVYSFMKNGNGNRRRDYDDDGYYEGGDYFEENDDYDDYDDDY